MKTVFLKTLTVLSAAVSLASCSKNNNVPAPMSNTITIQNVLQSQPLAEYGTFANPSSTPLAPDSSVSFSFYATKGQTLTFAMMYGWSNDWFFAPTNPGIALFDNNGMPLNNVDVSSQIKLWDNGTRVNQMPGQNVMHPGVAQSPAQNITEVVAQSGSAYLQVPASQLVNAMLTYNSATYKFTLTIKNNSKGTANQTPFSPGVWAISYNTPGGLLNPNPLYQSGQPSVNGLTNIAEMGDTTKLVSYAKSITGIFTPLSPVLVVVYNGINNPIYTVGQKDAGNGLTKIAQMGDASVLAAYLKNLSGVKNVYVLGTSGTPPVLLPMIGSQAGSSVSQQLSVVNGDKIAIATMYGFSNDWFFATMGEIDATQKGDISSQVALFDDGTAVNQFPGAGANQGGTPIPASNPIMAVPNPNAFTTLPAINNIIKVTLQ